MTRKPAFRARDIQIGVAYDVAIGSRIRSVRIDKLASSGVWSGTILYDRREVFVVLADFIRVSVPSAPCIDRARAAAGDLS